jgi:hypothetical protein
VLAIFYQAIQYIIRTDPEGRVNAYPLAATIVERYIEGGSLGIIGNTNENASDDIGSVFDSNPAAVIFYLNRVIAVEISLEVFIKILNNILPFHFCPAEMPDPFPIDYNLMMIIASHDPLNPYRLSKRACRPVVYPFGGQRSCIPVSHGASLFPGSMLAINAFCFKLFSITQIKKS